jgi:hypothetical protein
MLQLVQSIQENGVWSQRLGLVRVQGQTAEYENDAASYSLLG